MRTIDHFTNQILRGDCISVMAEMPSTSIDFVLTDPPYLVNYRSSDGRRYPNDDNDQWLKPAFSPPYTFFLLNGDIELDRNGQLFVEKIL